VLVFQIHFGRHVELQNGRIGQERAESTRLLWLADAVCNSLR